ncbi:molybdopterin-containing oxidoreductase family protein [Mycobacterium palustre]|uniref:Molybdopterin oxidoreductase n=1 Tax=Mycobacterium palustre TaxID=153971 RepID=A0A1X1ZHF8_9MYCO|nr:molybdopterin-dependent oxidoreductase [Mycobacterium palustre]MCV7100983.1 molybdopterin-dependent oxidoreductase [Mycobacterium palustre]ORW22750.1 molybdopterin oxidoreductase [Mycobacterium palustre]
MTRQAATRTVRSFCRICTSVCGILVDVDGDTVTRVRGDREHPRSKGYTCPKGRALPKMHHHPDRIERPMMRVDGDLVPATWQECLDDLGARLNGIIADHGPQSVGIFFGSGLGMDAAGYRTAQALHAALGTPAKFSPMTIDGTAKVLVSDLVGGSIALSGRPDYDNAEFVLLIGTNPVVSHGHNIAMPNPKGYLRALTQRAALWVIDPRHTETARLATGHLAPRPGTDYAVLAFLVRELLCQGADFDFLAQHTTGSDALAEAVTPFTLDHTARITDVPEAGLTRLLAAVRRAGRVAVETGTGVTMSAGANVTQWLSWALMAVTGSLNRPGGYWFHPGYWYQLETFELPVSPAEGSFGPGPRSRPETRSMLDEWPCAALADEIDAGNIRALLNLGGSLITGFPDADVLVPALRKLEVLATVEIIGNETTLLSTHVLPTKDQLERADVTLWDVLLTQVAAQYTPAVVAPVGDRRSAWWVLAELGRRLGYQLAETTGEQAGDDAMLAAVAAGARAPLRRLVEEGCAEESHQLPAPWVDRHVERLGGWRLAPRLLVEQLATLPEPAPLVLVPRRQRSQLNSQLEYLGEPAEILIHPDDAAAAGVLDAQAVIVCSANGELTGVARLDASIRRGAVSIPHGHSAAANVNRLTSKDDLDSITGMTRYSGVPITVGPAS